MSRATARQAIVDWFTTPPINGVTATFRSFPKMIDGGSFMTAGASSGAVLIPEFVSEQETRVAFGGALAGMKRIDYQTTLGLYFKSYEPDPVVAMDVFDATIELVKGRIRFLGRTLGTSGYNAGVFQFGEGTGTTVRYNPPALLSQTTEMYAALSAVLTEFIVA